MATCYRYHGRETSRKPVKIANNLSIWLARMIIGEGGSNCSEDKAAALVWAILNRYFLHRARHKWHSLIYLIRSFSQPINPRWQEGGDLAVKYAGTYHVTPERLRRRKRISELQWGEIPWEIEDIIIKFENGTVPPPPNVLALKNNRISNWASHKNMKKKYPWGIAIDGSNRPDWAFEDRCLVDGSVIVDYWWKE